MIKDRKILTVNGNDSESFLQQMLTNNIRLIKDDLQYNLILTPQGKLLHDLFIRKVSENKFMLDCHSDAIESILNLFQKYRLGSKVDFIIDDTITVKWCHNHLEDAYQDPRHSELGCRIYSEKSSDTIQSLDEIHYKLSLPQLYIDFESGKYFPFDVGFNKCNSISYDKGCYIGQEVITRTHFRGVVRKKVYKVKINTQTLPNDLEIFVGDRKVGSILRIYNQYEDNLTGLAIINSELINNSINSITLGNNKIQCEIIL
jgi:folate-binding protein YgfZ